MSRTIVYIDGLNFYYGAVRRTPYKWVDLGKLCRYLLPRNQIVKIKYFTSRVLARPGEPDPPLRQQAYLRALRTLPDFETHFGHFLSHRVRMPTADSRPGAPRFVDVIKTEEKGSDVNLASHLLHDAHEGRFDVGVVVTNDSDLVEPIRLVRQELGLPVGILNPYPKPAVEIQRTASFIKPIRKGVLAASQFADTLQDSSGMFFRPKAW